MAKRFTATEIWNEDWFLDMPMEYKLFWYYMLSTCNHAGFYKVNLRSFCGLNGVNLTSTKVLEYFNAGKQRIRVINTSLWLIDDFFVYQYGSTLNPNNRVHASIVKEYLKHGIELTSIRGLKDLKDGVKDKDKDKDKDLLSKEDNTSKLWFLKFYHSTYESYKSIFNGQSTTEDYFNEWKKFIDFIYENKYEPVFDAKFVSPHSFEILVKKDKFTSDMWGDTLKKILATGIKPEHDLFFRIPEFMKYVKNSNNGTDKQAVGTTKFNVGAIELLNKGKKRFADITRKQGD